MTNCSTQSAWLEERLFSFDCLVTSEFCQLIHKDEIAENNRQSSRKRSRMRPLSGVCVCAYIYVLRALSQPGHLAWKEERLESPQQQATQPRGGHEAQTAPFTPSFIQSTSTKITSWLQMRLRFRFLDSNLGSATPSHGYLVSPCLSFKTRKNTHPNLLPKPCWPNRLCFGILRF